MFNLPDWISDHAVLTHLQGTATGDTVTVNGKTVAVKDGSWKTDFEDGDVRIEDADRSLVLHNIRNGLVVLAAGQSNMEWPVRDSRNEKEIRDRIRGRDITWLQVPRVMYDGDDPEESWGWTRLDPDNIQNVSAVALLAALELETDRPIGLVGCYKGGSSAASWVSKEDLNTDPDLKQFYVTEYWQGIEDQTEEEEDRKRAEFDELVRNYEKTFAEFEAAHPELDRATMKEILGHTPFPGPKGHKDFLRPAGLYRTMFQKLEGLAPDILLWYQGEEDTKFARGYARLLKLLIARWRKELGTPDLPVVIAQLPGYREHEVFKDWGAVRMAQMQVADEDPYGEIVCLLDAGDHENIHPQDKAIPGFRMGRMAAKMLGMKDWVNAPRALKREGDFVIFDQVLKTGSDRVRWSSSYGLEKDPEPGFWSQSGMPAFPFDFGDGE